jgi:hypothetical protein
MSGNLRNLVKSEIVELHVTLAGSQPKIWRLIQVPETFTLAKFHETLQVVMGWEDTHLHEFRIGDRRYIDPSVHEDARGGMDERKVKLGDFVADTKTFKYLYDFGDSWLHEIGVIRRFTSSPDQAAVPLCVGGERACPPEDCGGIDGYAGFLKKVGSSSHPEHREALDWVGGFFDPAGFDPNGINRELRG